MRKCSFKFVFIRLLKPRFFSLPVIENEDNLKIKIKIKNAKKQEYDREYRLKNKEKINEKQRQYEMKNKEKLREKKREYYIQNREIIYERQKDYDLKNKETRCENQRKNYLKNKDKIFKKKREYVTNNKEMICEKRRKYDRENYLRSKEKIAKRKREHYIRNKEKMSKKNREYYIKNKDNLREYTIKKNKEQNEYYVPRITNLFSWKDSLATRKFFDYAAKYFDISNFSDWYRISTIQIRKAGGAGMFSKFGTLGHALLYAYPEFPWDLSAFSSRRGKKSAQRWLLLKMKELLPTAIIIEEYYHPDLVWDVKMKNKHMQLDLWVADPYNFALEYQGEHHYYDLHRAYGPGSSFSVIFKKDEKKKQICILKGITLICIPYWWDGKADSLSSTLHQFLPELFPKTSVAPIDLYSAPL